MYKRWVRRMPAQKAIVALAHRLLKVVHAVMTSGTPYQELGATYHDERDRAQIVLRAVRRLEKLGYRVTVSPPHQTTPTRYPTPASGAWGTWVVAHPRMANVGGLGWYALAPVWDFRGR